MQAIAAPPPRRSLAGWAVLAVMLIVFSYVFTVLLAIACAVLPCLLLWVIPFNLSVLLLVAGGVMTSFTMFWSLAPRKEKFQPPGPLIDPAQEPRLFSELRNISEALQEPMPAEVYLIPDVNAFVAERGGTMGMRSQRVMALGLPLIRILTVSQFRAVVAHEFAHYYAGDTNLGPWIYRTRRAMHRTLVSLSSPSGPIHVVRFNAIAALVRGLVLSLLAGYWKWFMRATFVVSRKQEFRADELACWLAGSRSLVDGLCAIARASAAGQSFWQTELGPALQAGYRPPVAEGFALFLSARGIAQATAAHLAGALRQSKTNPYDTHPPLSARVAAAQALPYAAPAESDASAISLISHVDVLELQLLEARIPQLKKGTLKTVSWEQVGPQIYIPSWRKFVAEHQALLAGLTVESLPETVKNLRAMGTRMRDPKGMLLTHEQRAGRASGMLWMSLALALIDSGWELCARPGESYLQRSAVMVKPAEIVAGLMSGKVTGEAWRAQCEAAGIAGLRLDGLGAAGAAS